MTNGRPMFDDSEPIAALEGPATESLEKVRIPLNIALRVCCPATKGSFLRGAGDGVMLV